MKPVAIFSALVVALAIMIPFLPLSGEARVYEDTIRLHVLANSDSDSDQKQKLLVRDALLERVSALLDECESRDEALWVVENNKKALVVAARDVLHANGSDDPVSIELGEEYYPEREYDGVRLPSGTYTSLRVIIGKGEGHNWWCVLYPPLCTSAAQPSKELAAAGFTPSQIRVLTENENPRYVVRFRIVELFSQIADALRG